LAGVSTTFISPCGLLLVNQRLSTYLSTFPTGVDAHEHVEAGHCEVRIVKQWMACTWGCDAVRIVALSRHAVVPVAETISQNNTVRQV